MAKAFNTGFQRIGAGTCRLLATPDTRSREHVRFRNDSLEAIATLFFSSRSVNTWNSSPPSSPPGWGKIKPSEWGHGRALAQEV
ncbi:hypothetical protein [Actinoplanes awajinensis]